VQQNLESGAKVTYLYPKDIREFKHDDHYQIKHPVVDIWNDDNVYNANCCQDRKNYIKYLIVRNRIRIKK